MSEPSVTQFDGVTTAAGRGVQKGVGPYEFFTDTGAHVYLHDADLLDVTWNPDASLRFRFAYDPDWTPEEAKDTPVIELTFQQVQILRWDTDMQAATGGGDYLRQVRDFAWDGFDGFAMASYTVNLDFTAARMNVVLTAPRPDDLR
jgi:hypothetical protein